jgi:hypothetical protein
MTSSEKLKSMAMVGFLRISAVGFHFKQPNSRGGEGTKGIRIHGPQDHRSTCAR